MCCSFVNISYFSIQFLQYTLNILYFRNMRKKIFFEARTWDYILKIKSLIFKIYMNFFYYILTFSKFLFEIWNNEKANLNLNFSLNFFQYGISKNVRKFRNNSSVTHNWEKNLFKVNKLSVYQLKNFSAY